MEKNYKIQNPQGKYLSFNMQGNPQFFEGIDMSYSFTKEQAETILERYSELNLTITTRNQLKAI
jgi:hypothetical protein